MKQHFGYSFVFLLASLFCYHVESVPITTMQPEINPPITDLQRRWYLGLVGDDNGAPSTARRRKRQTINFAQHERYEYHSLPWDERITFMETVWATKHAYPDPDSPWSEYDLFVLFHQQEEAPAAHNGAAFLPWHRENIFRFERCLLRHNPNVTLPYWDSTLDQNLPYPEDSAMWTQYTLGNGVGEVTNGHFQYWTAIPDCTDAGETLARNITKYDGHEYLYSDEKINWIYSKTAYYQIVSYTGGSTLEDNHHMVQKFVGGQMADDRCAPTDPAFFIHFAFLDCVWETFRREYQTTPVETEYPTSEDGDIGGPQHGPWALMRPSYGIYNIHGLSEYYNNYYYTCAPRPGDCTKHEDCGTVPSDMLYCDMTRGRCQSKIKEGGRCADEPDESCWCPDADVDGLPQCDNGICKCVLAGANDADLEEELAQVFSDDDTIATGNEVNFWLQMLDKLNQGSDDN